MQSVKNLMAIAAVALAGSSMIAPSPAGAKPGDGATETVTAPRADPDTLTRPVNYLDLDLATPAGEKKLNRRVRGAVRMVCAEAVMSGDFAQEYTCQRRVWNGARPQVARALMRAREIASTGTSAIAPVAISLSAFNR